MLKWIYEKSLRGIPGWSLRIVYKDLCSVPGQKVFVWSETFGERDGLSGQGYGGGGAWLAVAVPGWRCLA